MDQHSPYGAYPPPQPPPGTQPQYPWSGAPANPWAPPGEWIPYGSVLPQDNRSNTRVVAGIVAGVVLLVACLGAAAWAASRASRRLADSAGAPVSRDHHGQAPLVGAQGSRDGVVVDDEVAAKVLAAYWPVHEQALVDRDLATLSRLSAGPAQEWEVPGVACGCVFLDAVRPLLGASYLIPRQTTYPAYFVTEAATITADERKAEVLVFTKDGANAPWRVTQDSAFGAWPGQPLSLGHAVVDRTGFDRPVSPELHRRAQAAAADLAAVWQAAKDSGTVVASTEFDLSGQAGARMADLASRHQSALDHIDFYISPEDSLVEVTSTNGSDLACQPIRFTHVYRADRLTPLVQDVGRREWGPDLKPGRYRQITRTGLFPTCFLVPAEPAAPIVIYNHEHSGGRTTGVR